MARPKNTVRKTPKTKLATLWSRLKQQPTEHERTFRILVIICFAIIASILIAQSNAATSTSKLDLKIATYNVLGSGYKQAAPFNTKHATSNAQRVVDVADTIKNRSIDILGTQELDGAQDQFGKLQNALPGYTSHPTAIDSDTRMHQRAVFWKTNKFTIMAKGNLAYPFQDAPYLEARDKAPWVLLKDKNTGVQTYVISIHLIAGNDDDCRYDCNPPYEAGYSDKGGAQKRQRAAELLRDWARAKKDNYPVVVLGDFNSRFTIRPIKDAAITRSELPYCILTADYRSLPLLRNAYDVAAGRSGQCPYTGDEALIDHIYLTQKFKVTNIARPSNINTLAASDHMPLIVSVSVSYKKDASGKVIADDAVDDSTEKVPTSSFALPDDALAEE